MRFKSIWQTALLALFLLASAASTAQSTRQSGKAGATGWPGNATRAQFPTRHIKSYSQIITGSGEAADIYFPAPPLKNQTPSADRFPLILMMQGALVDKEYYSQFAQGVARHGFVVVVPNQASSVFGGQALFAELRTINEVLQHMRMEAAATDSPVYGVVDTSRMGLAGHSFGGAASLFAMAQVCSFPFCDPATGFMKPPELQAAALAGTHAPYFDFDTSGVAVALLAGEDEANLQPVKDTFENLEAPRALMVVRGANHFGLSDVGAPPGAVINPEETPQELPQAITAAQFSHWAGLFLRAHLQLDWHAWRQIYSSDGDAAVEVTGTPY